MADQIRFVVNNGKLDLLYVAEPPTDALLGHVQLDACCVAACGTADHSIETIKALLSTPEQFIPGIF